MCVVSYDELRSKGQEASYEKILENVEERDRIDQTREVGPYDKRMTLSY